MGIIIPTDFHIFQDGWNHQPSWKVTVEELLELYTKLRASRASVPQLRCQASESLSRTFFLACFRVGGEHETWKLWRMQSAGSRHRGWLKYGFYMACIDRFLSICLLSWLSKQCPVKLAISDIVGYQISARIKTPGGWLFWVVGRTIIILTTHLLAVNQVLLILNI
jgi:hypothetical protein